MSIRLKVEEVPVKWDYLTADCYYVSNCKQCKDEHGKSQSHWALNIGDNKHHWLNDGLKYLGAEGWELAAAQRIGTSDWGPSHLYIFKKPLSG